MLHYIYALYCLDIAQISGILNDEVWDVCSKTTRCSIVSDPVPSGVYVSVKNGTRYSIVSVVRLKLRHFPVDVDAAL